MFGFGGPPRDMQLGKTDRGSNDARFRWQPQGMQLGRTMQPGMPGGGGMYTGMSPGHPQPGPWMAQEGLGHPNRDINPMGRFEQLFTQGLAGPSVGMGHGPPDLSRLGSGSSMGTAAGHGGTFGDMNPLEKMFLITSGVGAAADIGTGIYDRMKEARKEREEEERRARGGKSFSQALTRPYRS